MSDMKADSKVLKKPYDLNADFSHVPPPISKPGYNCKKAKHC